MSRRTYLRICRSALSNPTSFLNSLSTLSTLQPATGTLCLENRSAFVKEICQDEVQRWKEKDSPDVLSQLCRDDMKTPHRFLELFDTSYAPVYVLGWPEMKMNDDAFLCVNSTKMRRKKMMNKHKHRKRLKKNRNKTKR